MRPQPPSRLSGRLTGLAVALLPAGQRDRYGRELYAELFGMTRPEQLRHAVQVLLHAPALRTALLATTSEGPLVTTTTKPLRCRLRLHRWDQRENPETHDLYEVCLLCDAYRDHPGAAPGAVSAGLAGGMSTGA